MMLYPDDFVVYQGGKIAKVPKFYDRQYEFECPEELANVKVIRRIDALRRKWDNTPDRLEVREAIAKKKLEQLSRSV